MTTQMIKNAKKMSRAIMPQVNALLIARVKAETIRKQIDAMDRELLTAEIYRPDPDTYSRDPENMPERIIEPRDIWTMSEDDYSRYQQTRDDRIQSDGWIVKERGFCPALVAEYSVTQCEWALCEEAEKHVAEMNHERISRDMDLRDRAIEIMIGLAVNAPGYRKPTQAQIAEAMKASKNI